MSDSTLFTVALISDVFFDNNPEQRLADRLGEARDQGADLAVLPEIPVNPWSPATKNSREDDVDPPGGPREQMQADAARNAGIALIGGVIRKEDSGQRYNTALVFDGSGELLGTHQKWHIPEEPGFWESSHYEAGVKVPSIIEDLAVPLGVQICSDINRPEGSHLLAALGAELICAPRSTELATYWKWKPVFQANAVTSCAYVVSPNRPAPEQGVLIGGPSIAVSPTSEVLLETTDPVGIVEIDRDLIARSRIAYPGYLPVRADLYAEAWSRVAGE